MTEKPKCQTAYGAAQAWLESKDGQAAVFNCRFVEPETPLIEAFAAGVEWLAHELNESMAKRGSRK